jgi:hypothetical protein
LYFQIQPPDKSCLPGGFFMPEGDAGNLEGKIYSSVYFKFATKNMGEMACFYGYSPVFCFWQDWPYACPSFASCYLPLSAAGW